ncbi:peptidase domain-containing ABC transporter [Acidisphaera sp. S103]|uniref:peptidase domain-containing ABC transporter n=1 Tax=Acidisphaera sp. S103 TaxID=1747223 RepID=UPI00131DCDE7|nr:peptidase domain-containing ABC transporter [Acidisphaera sp. S103]
MRNLLGRRTVPDIRQSEAAECGLTCLAMVLGYHGHDVDLGTLRRRHPTSLSGLTMRGLMALAARMDLTARALRLEAEQLGMLALPAVLHWDMDHFVVLVAIRRNGSLVVHDPARGERRIGPAEAGRRFTGVAMELTPTHHFRQADARAVLRLRHLLGSLRGFGGSLAQILTLSLLLQLYVLASPFFMQLVVDDAVGKGDPRLLLALAIGFGLLAVLNAGATALRAFVVQFVQSVISVRIGVGLFQHLIRLPFNYFEKRHVGDLVSRFGSADNVRSILAEGVTTALVDGSMTVLTLAMMLAYAPSLAGIVLLALGVYTALRIGLFPALRRRFLDLIENRARETSVLVETVRAEQTIKMFGCEAQREAIWANRRVDRVNAETGVARLQAGFKAANDVLFGLENIAVVCLGGLAALDGRISVGMLFAFVAYKTQFAEKAGRLLDKAIELRMLRLHLERLADIALTEPEAGLDQPAGYARPLLGAIEVRGLSFRYSVDEPFVLQDVSFSIAPGEHVAIAGASGCGKTTLLKILVGLVQPTAGAVLMDGLPLPVLGPRAFREQIGVVMQDDQLLSGSIADNICCFDQASDLPHMRDCAELAGIHDEIMRMPMAYNTLIGDMGSALSGGQKQRILLARALYRRPKLLFIDEGTSHLDVRMEEQVNAAVRGLGLTRVSIAHRPQTLASADRVLHFAEDGLRETILIARAAA